MWLGLLSLVGVGLAVALWQGMESYITHYTDVAGPSIRWERRTHVDTHYTRRH